jgi:hypothetical protein
MTSPHSGDSDPASLAVLATRLEAIRRETQALADRLDTLATSLYQHTAILDGLPELRDHIDQVLALLTSPGTTTQPSWFWLTMSDAERADKHAELADWVDTVLRTQYPSYLANRLMPCWPNHPEAPWELTWLYQLWSNAYLSDHPAPKDAADWHDRWLPGSLYRLSQIMNQCQPTCQNSPT